MADGAELKKKASEVRWPFSIGFDFARSRGLKATSRQLVVFSL